MITLEEIKKIIETKNSYFKRIDGNKFSFLIHKWPYLTTFELTIYLKEHPNHIYKFYPNLNPFDLYDIIREYFSPLNNK